MSDFESYCSRMWLDYCDENTTLHSECLPKDAYVERWYDWLLDKYQIDKWQNREEPLSIQEEIDLFRTDPEC